MFLNRKYLDVKYFYYRSGSVFFRTHLIYEIEFINKKLIRFEEKDYKRINEKVLYLDDKLINKIKREIYNTKYYLYESKYINRRIKDGHQWQLIVKYKDQEIKSNGSNAFPNNFKIFEEFIKHLDKLLED